MGAANTRTTTTNGDICHHHRMVTKAYCLLETHLGRRFLTNLFRNVIGGQTNKHQFVSHVEEGGILTSFSSTVISCVPCPGFSASRNVDVLVDLKKKTIR